MTRYIPHRTMVLIQYIRDVLNQTSECPTHIDMICDLNWSSHTIIRYIRRLEQSNELEVIRRRGIRNRYLFPSTSKRNVR